MPNRKPSTDYTDKLCNLWMARPAIPPHRFAGLVDKIEKRLIEADGLSLETTGYICGRPRMLSAPVLLFRIGRRSNEKTHSRSYSLTRYSLNRNSPRFLIQNSCQP